MTKRALLILTTMAASAAVHAQTTTEEVSNAIDNSGPGLDHVGGYMIFGLGSYALHERTFCPADPHDNGCTGQEPINFTSGHHGALNGTLGFRFSRYFAFEVLASLMPGGFNTTRNESPSPKVTDSALDQLMDVQPRVRVDLPLTSQLALYGTAGVGWKISNIEVGQNVQVQNGCQEYNAPTDPNYPNSGGCKIYQYQYLSGTVADRTAMYFPVSVGLEWWFAPQWGIGVNYQPPLARGDFAFHRMTLDLMFTL